jgi:CheY-like chemotaxis protein
MGGTLAVESRVGHGTTFCFTIPAAVDGSTPRVQAPVKVAKKRRGRLLVVDDEDTLLKAIGRILVEHEVVCLCNGAEALARLQEDGHFDVILCDLMMPKMDGMDLYERLLQLRPELARRMVFMTGGAITTRTEQFLKTVANERIAKPFSVVGLREKVEAILNAAGPKPAAP